MLPLAWLHDINPIAIPLPFFFNGGIHWYGIAYLVGFFIAWLLLRRLFKVGVMPSGVLLTREAAGDFISCCCIGLLIGGRLGYCLVYDRSLLGFTAGFPYWSVLAIWKGGMASHGGMIGAGLGAWWWCRKYKIPLLFGLDIAAFATPLGLLLGRCANFINGELVGRPCSKDFKLACQFPQEILDWNNKPDRMILLEDGTKASGRELLELVKNGYGDPLPLDKWHEIPWAHDEKMRHALQEILPYRHPSTLYAACAEGLFVFACLLIAYKNPRKTGLIAGVFCLAYSAARLLDERFRMPDVQFIANDGKLPLVTMGQWLTLGVLATGTFLVARAILVKDAPALGGWNPSKTAQTPTSAA